MPNYKYKILEFASDASVVKLEHECNTASENGWRVHTLAQLLGSLRWYIVFEKLEEDQPRNYRQG